MKHPSSPAQPFDSAETGHPFNHCIDCGLPLLEIGAPWTVTKEFANEECVLEYAICMPCRDRLAARMSTESRARVEAFLESEIDWESRLSATMEHAGDPDPSRWLGTCAACGAPRQGLANHAISALFEADGRLQHGPLPLMLCGHCGERVQTLLSEQTRDVWERFVAEHFPGPPGEAAPLPRTRMPAIF